MSKAPDFDPHTIEILSQRSAMICNNPKCLTITVGPSDASGALRLKLGEAAHIKAARPGARWDENMTDDQRADISNGIWLCANCHTLIDKNKGLDVPSEMLNSWKLDHEDMIRALLLSHRSPVAYLRKVTKEGRLAQNVVNIVDQHGALFQSMNLENPDHVIKSVDQLRKKLESVVKEIQYDRELKSLLQRLNKHLREFMNFTSVNRDLILTELPTMRNRVGLELKQLRDQYGCTIPQNVSSIVPN